MEYYLTSDAVTWREIARAYADEVVRPVAPLLDAASDPADSFSWDLVREADLRGLRQAPLPAAYGGVASDPLTNVVILEEIAAADMGIAAMLSVHWRFAQVLHRLGTEDQCERFLGRSAANPLSLFAAALTEPGAGSDNLLPFTGPGAGAQTYARKVSGGYVLNGQKCFISNANRAETILTFARTDRDGPVQSSLAVFIAPSTTEGLRFGKVHDKLGERTTNNAEIYYDDVFVPEADVLGTPGSAMQEFVSAASSSIVYPGACALGVARECFDRTLQRCRTRIQGGVPIIQHQAVGAHLADMYLNVDATRSLLWRAAAQARQADDFDPALAIESKLFAAERVFDSARRMMELWGGAGYMRDTGVEKLLRDATVWLHSDGTNMIMREKLANLLRQSDSHSYLWDRVPVR